MRFDYTLTASIILTLTSSVLATSESLATDAYTALRARDVVTATWQDSGSFSLEPNPKEDDRVRAKKRKVVDPYTVPYPLQTGPTRYAPMAKKPGAAIATTSPTPQFPASPYKIATEYLKPGTVETTLTETATLAKTMIENTATPAPNP
ncbi:hypothetical protein BJY04DRAFT_79226 [Aspergillus karnatakaensis]|uniref:putative beta-1,6-glucan biosynthesis protein (Knh1) n=1 Tax=Aspergillus karnatakaensis TaxID=1810916 RepID=UPI003CCD9789